MSDEAESTQSRRQNPHVYGEEWVHDITALPRLESPEGLRLPCLRTGLSRWRRSWRYTFPNATTRDCCWFHAGSWAEASQHAEAAVLGLNLGVLDPRRDDSGEDYFAPVERRLENSGLTGWLHEAVDSLIHGAGEPINYGSLDDWEAGDDMIVGGRHRVAAMLQQGVRTTVTMRVELHPLQP